MSSKSHFFKRRGVNDLIDGLIHHYSFEETTGIVANDEIGSSNGVLFGSPLLNQAGKVNKCFKLDGVNDSINFNNNLDLISFPFSVKFWAKKQTATSVVFSGDTLTAYAGVTVSVLSNGDVYVRFGSGGSFLSGDRRDYRTSTTPLDSSFKQVVVNFNSFGNIEIYVDNVLIPSVYASGTSGSVDLVSATYKSGFGGGGFYYRVEIDELSLFSKKLDTLQRTDIFNMESAGNSIL